MSRFWEWVKTTMDGRIIPIFRFKFKANGYMAKKEDQEKRKK